MLECMMVVYFDIVLYWHLCFSVTEPAPFSFS
jgi:hypothetical protein